MDDLNKLFSSKEYDEIIKLTNNKFDSKSLFYRLATFLILGKNKDAILMLEDKKINEILYSEKPKYVITIHFKLLQAENDFAKLFNCYNDYINRPYISQEVEEVLRDFSSFLKSKETKQHDINFYLDILKKSNEIGPLTEAIIFIKNEDYKKYSRELIDFICKDSSPSELKSYCLLMLSTLNLNQKISFYKNDKNYDLDLSKLVNPYNEDFNKVIDLIKSKTKNVTILDVTIKLFNNFIIDLYPDIFISEFSDLNLLSLSFVYEASKRIEAINDNDFFNQYKISANELKEYHDKILKVLKV